MYIVMFSWCFNIYLIEKTTPISCKSCWNCYTREETAGSHVIKKSLNSYLSFKFGRSTLLTMFPGYIWRQMCNFPNLNRQ